MSNEELSLFIQLNWKRYTYYIDFENKRNEKGRFYMQIKHLKEHPQYSRSWLKDTSRKKEEMQDVGQAFEDIEIRDVVVQAIKEVHPPSPPPPPPINLNER